MKRKPIQIAAAKNLYVLCDDGSLWQQDTDLVWVCLPHIPNSHAEFIENKIDEVTSLFRQTEQTGSVYDEPEDTSSGWIKNPRRT